MEFYTFDALMDCIWKTDNDRCVDISGDYWKNNPNGGYIKITNYNEVMNNIFTSNGLEQFETFMKNDLSTIPFIKEENGNKYVNAPTSGFYTGYTSKNLRITNIQKDKIEASIEVVDAFAEMENEDNAVETKNIIKKRK